MEKKVVKAAVLAATLIVFAGVVIALIMGLATTEAAGNAETFYGNEPAVISYEETDTVYAIVSSAEGTETDEQPAEEPSDNTDVAKAIGAAVAIAIATAAGAISMGLAISKTNESIARQPEMEGKLRSSMMLGLVFIETVMIYALVMGILIVFVL